MKKAARKSRLSLLAAIVAITLMRPLPAPGAPQTSTDVELERFFDSDYTWCDVQLLSSYWDQGYAEAKARIGRKIGWGDEQFIEEYLGDARGQANDRGERCDYHENGFTYEDAEALSSLWEMPIGEVKTFVEDKLFYGNGALVHEALAEAGDAQGSSQLLDPVEEFWAEGFTYCDARLVAAFWQEEVFETKQMLGEKILAGNWEDLDWNFETARDELDDGALADFTCDYTEEGYTYDDMVALAEFWEMSVGETKETVEYKLLWGQSEVVDDALEQIRG